MTNISTLLTLNRQSQLTSHSIYFQERLLPKREVIMLVVTCEFEN